MYIIKKNVRTRSNGLQINSFQISDHLRVCDIHILMDRRRVLQLAKVILGVWIIIECYINEVQIILHRHLKCLKQPKNIHYVLAS